MYTTTSQYVSLQVLPSKVQLLIDFDRRTLINQYKTYWRSELASMQICDARVHACTNSITRYLKQVLLVRQSTRSSQTQLPYIQYYHTVAACDRSNRSVDYSTCISQYACYMQIQQYPTSILLHTMYMQIQHIYSCSSRSTAVLLVLSSTYVLLSIQIQLDLVGCDHARCDARMRPGARNSGSCIFLKFFRFLDRFPHTCTHVYARTLRYPKTTTGRHYSIPVPKNTHTPAPPYKRQNTQYPGITRVIT